MSIIAYQIIWSWEYLRMFEFKLRSHVFVLQTFESWKFSLIIVEISSETLEEVHVRFLGSFSQEKHLRRWRLKWFDLHLISLLFWRYDWEMEIFFSFPFLLGNQDKIICKSGCEFWRFDYLFHKNIFMNDWLAGGAVNDCKYWYLKMSKSL